MASHPLAIDNSFGSGKGTPIFGCETSQIPEPAITLANSLDVNLLEAILVLNARNFPIPLDPAATTEVMYLLCGRPSNPAASHCLLEYTGVDPAALLVQSASWSVKIPVTAGHQRVLQDPLSQTHALVLYS